MTDTPIHSRYEHGKLRRISLPVGGIGTGTIGFGGRAELRDFQVSNRPATGFRPELAAMVMRVEDTTGVRARLLEGPLDDAEFDGDLGSSAANHGMPRFRSASFGAAYPFGSVTLTDPDMPTVDVEAFNPLIPADLGASSIPAVVLRYRITNDTENEMRVSIAASFENFVGADGTANVVGGNTNAYRESSRLAGIVMTAPELAGSHEAAGTFVFSTIRNGGDVSHRTGWKDADWSNTYLDFWDDFLEDGLLEDHASNRPRPFGSVTNEIRVPAGRTEELSFLLTWNFPNRRAWRSDDHGDIHRGRYTDDIVGNHYSTVHPDPWETAETLVNDLPLLRERSRRSTLAILGSSAPHSVIEAALFNVSTLRSPTLFRTADGGFYGWEGVLDHQGSCFGTCTHVWAYEFASALWFAEIAWSFRETQYLRSTDDVGRMGFRAALPASAPQQWELAAADGQMATLIHLYYDWRLSGDTEALRALWPNARRSLEFAWIPGGWDADQDGVMEGCQHNTMDVEYFGPNPQMQGWYLGALRAGEEIADALGERDFAERCRALFESGSRWTDAHLFNGEYYEHHIVPIEDAGTIARGLRQEHTVRDSAHPSLQLGKGVLIDQLVGQYAARLAGLGSLLDEGNVRTAIDTVFARNHRANMWGHFNHMRGYALDDDEAVLMATYAEGERPAEPFPYFNEVMTGFEYALALNHIQDGDRTTAETIIRSIRRRYDGGRRNPFDETECGRHYARAMASWSALVAWNDFQWDALTGVLSFSLSEGSSFWSTGSAAGEIRILADRIELQTFEGHLPLVSLTLGARSFAADETSREGDTWSWPRA